MNSATTAASEPLPARQPAVQRLLDVLLILLVFFIAAGDPAPHVNEPHYLCRLKHNWDPAWCAGDLFLESTDTQLVFIWLFGWVTRWLSLSATAWVGRLIAWTLLAWSWQRLSWRIVPKPLAAVLSAALFISLTSYAHLAGEWVVGGVEAKCFAYVFVLLALGELVDQRWNAVWLLLGAATAFHPLVGGWSALACGGIWLLDSVRQRGAALGHLRSMLPGLAAGGLLGLLGIVPALTLTWNDPPDVVADANRIYVFDRLPHHLAPLTLPWPEIAIRFGGHAALLCTLWILSRSLRATGTLGATGYTSARPRAVAILPTALAKPVTPLQRIGQFAVGAALVAATGLAIELVLWNHPLVAARLLRYYWFRLTDIAAAMSVALYATAFIAKGLNRRQPRAVWVFIAALLVAGSHLSIAVWSRAHKPVPPADAKIVVYPAWVEVCDWIAGNTPPDALFLTPRLNLSFKWRTGRPEVANRKDIPQNARDMVEWNRRIKELYFTEVGGIEQPLDSIGVLGTDRVRELAVKYGADYVVMDRGQLLSLPRAYMNEEYVVYEIED